MEKYLPADKVTMRSSDRAERAVVVFIEQEFRKRGALDDGSLWNVKTSAGEFRGDFSVPADLAETNPKFYYVRKGHSGHVYCSDGKKSWRVFKNRAGFLRNPRLNMIKVSPDGRYLVVIYEKKLGLPIPSPGGAYEMTVVELSGKKRQRQWSAEFFGSCVWKPDSKRFYFVSTMQGKGIYHLSVADAFD